MKKAILFLMAVMPALLFAQVPDNFTITAKVGHLSTPARAYLIYEAGGKNITDSTVIIDGTFSFHGHIAGPAGGYIAIDPLAVGLVKMQANKQVIDALQVYLEKANIVVTSPDSVYKATITGSKLNDESKQLSSLIRIYTLKAAELQAQYKAAPEAQQINPAFLDTLQAHSRVIQDQQSAALRGFIKTHPQSYMSLEAIRLLVHSGLDISLTEGMFTSLSPEMQQTELGKGFASAIQQLKVTAIGSMAPNFTQNDANGAPVSLASFKGKYVLIDFWASWCGPCRQENPHVVKVYDHYKVKNFTILGVSLDKPTDKALWIKAIKDDGLAWTQVSDLKYWTNDVALLYKIEFIPQNFLIDPTGKIIAKNLKGEDLDKKLAEIFKM